MYGSLVCVSVIKLHEPLLSQYQRGFMSFSTGLRKVFIMCTRSEDVDSCFFTGLREVPICVSDSSGDELWSC